MLSPLPGMTVHELSTHVQQEAFTYWLAEQKSVAIDTETAGLAYWDKTRLVQIGTSSDVWVMAAEDAAEPIRQCVAGHKKLVMHNAPFDIPHLVRLISQENPETVKRVMRNVDDTMVMSQLIDSRAALDGGTGHGLKDLCGHWLGEDSLDSQKALKLRFQELGFKNQADGWAQIPISDEVYQTYGAVDVALTHRLWQTLLPELKYLGLNPLWDLEREVAAVTTSMTVKGINVDLDAAYRAQGQLREEKALAECEAFTYGIDNVNSTKQVIAVLQAAGIKLTTKTDKGQFKVDKKVLAKIEHPAASAIVRAKEAGKALTSWVDPIIAHAEIDGRVHARIKANEARTGRMSVSNPPLQQLPKNDWRIRACLIPDDNMQMASIDYANVEVRVMAYLANEPKLIQAFVDGVDIHNSVAAQLYGNDFSPAQRSMAKSTVFGKVYGGGVKVLAATAGVSELEAKKASDKLSRAYPRLQRWAKNLIEKSKVTQKTVVTVTGRRLPIYRHHEYVITNHITQSTAADLLKAALAILEDKGLAHHVVMVIHDEFLIQADAEQIEEVTEAIRNAMQTQLGPVPITADVEFCGSSWGEKYRPKVATNATTF
jgi:DNA polymerase-1